MVAKSGLTTAGVLACGLALILFAHAPALAVEGPFYIHATEVNLRETPNGDVLLVFDLNDKVFVIENEGNWSYVSAPAHELKGWCWTAYIGEGRVGSGAESPYIPAPEAIDTVKTDAETVPVNNEQPPVEPAVDVNNSFYNAFESGSGTVEDVCVDPGTELDVVDDGDNLDITISMPVEGADKEETQPTPPADDDAGGIGTYSYGGGWDPPEQPEDTAAQPERVDDGFVPDGGQLSSMQEIAVESGAETGTAAFNLEGSLTTPDMLDNGKCYLPVGGHDIALISGNDVNVRNDSTLTSEVIGTVDKGDKLYIICSEDPWYYVSIPAKQLKGWVFGEYVNQLTRVEITGDQVRLREQPDTGSRIKLELSKGDVFHEFKRDGKWVLVASSASGVKGWVHCDFVKATERSASRPYGVTGDDVNFRYSPAVDSEIIAALNQGTEVQVLGRNEKWSYIEYQGQAGWMYSQYLSPNFRNAPKQLYGKSIGGRLIARAKAMEGTPYVWGGESDSGVDCSGLIYKLLLEEGADASGLPRRASTQMAGLGQEVDKEDLIPGDLVFFTTYKPGPSHVGIYLGDGDFIHASSAQGKVAISNMSEGYYKRRFVGARRITEEELRRLQ